MLQQDTSCENPRCLPMEGEAEPRLPCTVPRRRWVTGPGILD